MNGEQAKAAADVLAAVWEGEFPATCQVLAAVKNDARDYKPDAKSRSAWELAKHLATSDIWFLDSIIRGGFEFNAAAAKEAEDKLTNVDDVVAFYKKTLPERLESVRAVPAEKLAETMTFFGMFSWPRVRFIGFANNHSVHHRGQLAAYLRAMGSKVPNIYGPSADAEPAR
jgi:uncharacterized damage-inducible protein DinB